MPGDDKGLWLRTRGGAGIWYFRHEGKPRSTGRPASDRAGAEAVVAAFNAALAVDPPRGAPSSGVPVLRVLDAWLEKALTKAAALSDPVLAKTRRHHAEARVKALARSLASLRLGDLGAETFAAYATLRRGGSAADVARARERLRLPAEGSWSPPRGGAAAATVAADLSTLRSAVRSYVRAKGLQGMPNMPVPKAGPRGREEISRGELARLLWAARGRVWDAEAHRWVPGSAKPAGRRGADQARRFARLVLLAAYTASPCWCVIRLRWTGDPEGDVSFVDLDAPRPLLYRLGPDAAQGKSAGMPVLLNHRIAAHLRRWRVADACSGAPSPIHERGRPLAYPPHITFKMMLKAAGLSDAIMMDDLRLSAGTHLAAHDEVGTWGAALFMGMAAGTFADRYEFLRPDYQKEAVAAFQRRPGGRTALRPKRPDKRRGVSHAAASPGRSSGEPRSGGGTGP